MTTIFIVSYVRFALTFTLAASSVLEVGSGGGVAAAAADASDYRRPMLFEYMSPVALCFMAIFWTVLGVAVYRYSECFKQQQQRQQQQQQQEQQQQQQPPVSTATKRKSVFLLTTVNAWREALTPGWVFLSLVSDRILRLSFTPVSRAESHVLVTVGPACLVFFASDTFWKPLRETSPGVYYGRSRVSRALRE